MKTFSPFLFLVAALSPAASLPSQDAAARSARFALEAGDVRLNELIDLAAAFLGRNIIVSEAELATAGAGSGIKLQQRIETDAAGCEELLANLLYARGFALVPLDESKGVFEVVSLTGPRNREIANRAVTRTVDEVMARPQLRVFVTTVMPLKHINATIATNALRPFFQSAHGSHSGLTPGNVGNASAMILSGFQDQVAAAVRMLRAADVPPSPEQLGQELALHQQVQALQARVEALERQRTGGGK